MQKVFFDDRFLAPWITSRKMDEYRSSAASAEKMLSDKSGPGKEFLGWLNLPDEISEAEIKSIEACSEQIRATSDILICIGIGGSYLGARAAIEFLSPSFEDMRTLRVIFAGHQVNSDYLHDLLKLISGKKVSLNVISKSGTTTEPGITFRVLREWMEKTYGKKEASQRIIATTDPKEGALRKLATEEGYTSFSIPPDVGGRFSVLTAVGLLPIAVAGINIREILAGAREACNFCKGNDLTGNIASRYAIVRNILFRQGKAIEMLASFTPQLHFVNEWWKQLAGESEGKNTTGIFPAAVDYTTDLHSMGQWMQDGARIIFETFLMVKNTRHTETIPECADDADELNYLKGKSFEYVNENAFRGTLLAHLDGQVPASVISLTDRSPDTLGQLFYFFEKAIGVSGYILKVNPFNQPGVNAYKDNMFVLLSKPGFAARSEEIQQKIKQWGL